ncbi:hypothetical protein [Streptomyces sp. NPDC002205]|uniref:hypothetical protein n=1 Tax=Streptomyces sp. NPDC002205 TaxID=3154411 RepID=UPI00332B7354
MKLPRVECQSCGRSIAAGPVSGSLGKGRICRHDAPGARRDLDSSLVSCPGSLAVVDIPVPSQQLAFDVEEPQPEADETTPALFMISKRDLTCEDSARI